MSKTSEVDLLLHGIRDPRLAVHATSALPAWLWSLDGARILWTNAAGAQVFGARNAAILAERTIGAADQHRRQAAQLALRLPPSGPARLERLRGFGAPFGRLLTCSCVRLTFPDGTAALLIAAAEPVGRTIPLTERLASLAESVATPAMVFTPNGALAGVNEPAKRFAALLSDLTGPGFDDARQSALRDGQAVLQLDIGRVAVHRVGSADAAALVALIGDVAAPKPVPKPVPVIVTPETEQASGSEAVAKHAAPEPAAVPETVAADVAHISTPGPLSDQAPAAEDHPAQTAADEDAPAPQEAMPAVETQDNFPQNVVPFPLAEPKPPALTPVESNAFDELARRLSARLDGEIADETTPDERAATESFVAGTPVAETEIPPREEAEYPAFAPHEPVLPRGSSTQDTQLLDRVPAGILIYRLDRLIYANPAFLASTGYDSLHALSEAGGLDALTVESDAGAATSTSETGTPVVIAATSESGPEKGRPAAARLYAITWDDEPAHALVFSGPHIESSTAPHHEPVAVAAPVPDTQAEELAAILDTIIEGVVIFDGNGRLMSCNRGAELLFGRTDSDISALHVTDLLVPESRRILLDYWESVRTAPVADLLDHGREVQGRLRDGGPLPLTVTIGRTRPGSERFFAIFRDLSHARKSDTELTQARREAERAGHAKADILARISHEVRMPLNAIIGFSDVMIGERFGALGNERYAEYLKDIRASGQRVIAIIDDLLDLSRIETGKMELSFANQDLNSMVEQCVAVMQPQANRERIIIRTSLAHALPAVKADARALRQIALNLIGNSIHLANAGGQVIVSTATTDFGDIVLRVRDTGPGLNDNEIAAAMAPFRTPGASDQADGSVVNLSLTKALVEANRAQFHIKTVPHSGTLIEVVFSHASAIA